MTQAKKIFVVKAATNKIGATRAHNLLCSMKGGYEYVHETTDDFKNHQRDVNVFIENSELVAMFWADEVAKCNYKEFGDIVSFDATFNNNKYNMKFVPFIGVNNHRKCVTLGSGMLLHEYTTSYTWLIKAFMTAFLKELTMIETDQDGAMKRAIEAVFTKAKHRLCMWHIMQKIPSKNSTNFYLLSETDLSESENSFFKSFTRPGSMLVSFIMSYELAMERQRYRQEALDFKTIDAAPKCETKLAIERHVARVYTRTIFLLLQKEIIEEQENETRTVEETMIDYKNPTKAINKGEHLKKEERLKSEREKVLKVIAKPMKVCGHYNEKTNEHTKTTCPKNLKARKKRKATPIIDV
ncbi:regulation of nuclear pre-mRNA domain-containing protein 1B [Tanacetum coccineum]